MTQEWRVQRFSTGRSRAIRELEVSTWVQFALTLEQEEPGEDWYWSVSACCGTNLQLFSGRSETLEQAQEDCERATRGAMLKALEGLL